MEKKLKLSEVIAIWDEMSRIAPTAVKGFCDLDKACEKVVGVVNDLPGCQPASPPPKEVGS